MLDFAPLLEGLTSEMHKTSRYEVNDGGTGHGLFYLFYLSMAI
jgi:hypothetical protein